MKLVRQTDTCYPCYIAEGKDGKAWVEQTSRRWGWSVHLAGEDAGTPESLIQYFSKFSEAKEYAKQLVDLKGV